MTKYLILGLGTAGFAAALAIKKQDRNASITFIDKKNFDLLHSCGMPYAIEGRVSFDSLRHDISSGKMGIKIIQAAATKIDVKNKKIEHEKGTEDYDKLIIALGSYAFMPSIEGVKGRNVFHVNNIENAKWISENAKNVKSAVVIGAGAIGLETAFALKQRGLNVKIIEMLDSCLPKAIDKDVSEILEEYLKSNGIEIIFGKKLEKIEEGKVTVSSEEIETEIVIMAAGVKPRIKIAGDAGILTDKFGIVINEKMETNVKDVYAAGDCCQTKNFITGKKYPGLTATISYKQGTIAGVNASGGSLEYKGAITSFVSSIGDLGVAATGLNSYFAKESGFDLVIGKAKGKNKPEWFPDSDSLMVKVLADKKTSKIIGGQAVGAGAAGNIDVIATAIKAGMTLQKISEIELAYCPAISETYPLLQQAVDLAIRKIK